MVSKRNKKTLQLSSDAPLIYSSETYQEGRTLLALSLGSDPIACIVTMYLC